MYKLIISRYLLYALVGLEVFLAPIILSDKQLFGEYEYFKSIINLLPSFYFGVSTGYLYQYLKMKTKLNSEYLFFIFFVSLFFGSLISVLKGFSLLFVLISVLYGLTKFYENYFQAAGCITKSMSVKPLFSILLLFMMIMYKCIHEINLEKLYFSSLFLTVFALYFFTPRLKEIRLNISDVFYSIKKLIKSGFLFNFLTILFGFYIFYDRYMIKQLFFNELPSYSLAFSFMQVGLVGFSAIGIKSSYDYGKSSHLVKKSDLLHSLFKLMPLYFIVISGVFLLGYIYTSLIGDYADFYIYLIPLFLGIMINGVFGVISSLINYFDIEYKIIIIMIGVFSVKILLFYLLKDFLSAAMIIWISSVLVFTYVFISFIFIYNRAK